MFDIRNNKQVLLASSLATLLSILLSVFLAVISLYLFKIEPSLWKLIIGLSIIIPLFVAGLVTYIIFNQVMRLQLAKEQIEEMGRRDFLTKVYNRGYLMDVGHREHATANRYHQSLATMMIDLDYFKQINDTHGHIFGDKVIHDSARRINSLIRDSDILSRFGGDEFVLLLPHTKLEDAEKLARRIVRTMSETPIQSDTIEAKVTVSIGVATLKPEHSNIDKLIDASDQALYRAKQAGRNTSSA